jgi:hypothetical protein
MTSDENSIRTRDRGDIRFEEVTDMYVDAWGTEATGILMDDGLTLRSNLEGFDMQMRELQTGFYRDTACAKADVPKDMTTGEIEGLKCQQTDGHLGDHLRAAIEKGERVVWKAKGMTSPNPSCRRGSYSTSIVPPPTGGISYPASIIPPPTGGISYSTSIIPPPTGGISYSASIIPPPTGGISYPASIIPPPTGGVRGGHNHAVGIVEIALGGFFKGEDGYLFESRMAKMLANRHRIIAIAIVQHPLGDGGRGMLFICQHADLLSPFDKGFVEFRPGTACERNNSHIMIRHH